MNEKPKHTPGPFLLHQNTAPSNVITAPSGVVCTYQSPKLAGRTAAEIHAETEANGKLFASAPHMLEALEAVVDAFGEDFMAIVKAALAEAREGPR